MMKTDIRLAASLAALGALLAAHIVYLLLPAAMTGGFFVVRPVLYAAVAAAHFLLTGREKFLSPKSGGAFFAAGIGASLYAAALFVIGLFAGFGTNVLAHSAPVILRNAWVFAPAALLSEVLRFRIIRGAMPGERRHMMAVLITLVYTFAQLDILRGIVGVGPERTAEIIFISFFPALALNAVLSFMAYESPLAPLFIVRGTFSLVTPLLPVLPHVAGATWAVAANMILFVTVIFYYRQVAGKTGKFQQFAQNFLAKKQFSALAVIAAAALLFAAFTLRAFPVFPVVILTGSMEDTLSVGSVAFVRKVAPADVRDTVGEGQIILFQSGDAEIIHRVAGLSRNREGGRVFITKGDANPANDRDPVEPEQVIGTSRWHIPYIGYPVVFMRQLLR